MRVFEVKYLGPTNNRGGRLRVAEIQWGKRLPGRSYGYPYHVEPWAVEQWALSQHLGLESHDNPAIKTSVKVQTGVNAYILIIELA